MALFSFDRQLNGTGERLSGYARFRELLGRDFKRFFLVNLLTLTGFLPFFLGVLYALLSSSILVLIPACVIGGMLAGPFLSCTYDAVFRSLRDAPGGCMENFRRAWRQNWKASLLPGILFCLMLGFYAFMLMMFSLSSHGVGFGTIAVVLLGMVLFAMFFSVYWPLVVLFEQPVSVRFKNCLLFCVRFFWKILGCALLQILYWGITALLFPWSVILLLFLGIWFIVFVACFLLYDTMNSVFGIEEQIARAFPEQAAFYESDEEWLRRREREG